MIPVDGGGDQRQEAAGDEEDDPKTLEAERTTRGRKSSEKVSKFLPVGIYSPTCRCDRVEQLGGTEIHNCNQLLKLGVTERFKSVAPRLKT